MNGLPLVTPTRALIAGLAAVLLLVAGCDSNSPVDAPSPEDVEGQYEFTEYRFKPNGFPAISLLDTLVAENTYLDLFGSGEGDLRFKFEEGPSDRITGSFTVTASQLRMSFSGQDSKLERLLLSNSLSFQRASGGGLSLSADRTVNLEALNPDVYEGLTSVPGRLTLELRERIP